MKELSGYTALQNEPEQGKSETSREQGKIELENIQLKLNFVQKMLESKEESMNILDENLKSTKSELADLRKCFNDLQMDRDAKIKEIMNLQRAIDFHTNTIDELQREKLDAHNEILFQEFEDESNSSLMISNTKYQNEIKALKFDLDVMESLYKNCYEEMINQEKVINNLRQTCLDNSVKEINLKIDIEMLTDQLQSLKKYKNNNKEEPTIDFENDLSEISIHLNYLKQLLSTDITTEGNNIKRQFESLKIKNKKLKNKIIMLQSENFKLKKKKMKAISKYKNENIQSIMSNVKSVLNKSTKYCLENKMLKEEMKMVKTQLSEYEKNIQQYNESVSELNKRMVSMEDSIKTFNINNGNKTDCISWLESQLNESTEKGAEMCKKSIDIFEYVQQLLKQVKEERRNVSEKKVMLQKLLKFLAGKEDVLKYINCETLLKN